jgi:hypothetical protein
MWEHWSYSWHVFRISASITLNCKSPGTISAYFSKEQISSQQHWCIQEYFPTLYIFFIWLFFTSFHLSFSLFYFHSNKSLFPRIGIRLHLVYELNFSDAWFESLQIYFMFDNFENFIIVRKLKFKHRASNLKAYRKWCEMHINVHWL